MELLIFWTGVSCKVVDIVGRTLGILILDTDGLSYVSSCGDRLRSSLPVGLGVLVLRLASLGPAVVVAVTVGDSPLGLVGIRVSVEVDVDVLGRLGNRLGNHFL